MEKNKSGRVTLCARLCLSDAGLIIIMPGKEAPSGNANPLNCIPGVRLYTAETTQTGPYVLIYYTTVIIRGGFSIDVMVVQFPVFYFFNYLLSAKRKAFMPEAGLGWVVRIFSGNFRYQKRLNKIKYECKNIFFSFQNYFLEFYMCIQIDYGSRQSDLRLTIIITG